MKNKLFKVLSGAALVGMLAGPTAASAVVQEKKSKYYKYFYLKILL
jgi:hypothetical protein